MRLGLGMGMGSSASVPEPTLPSAITGLKGWYFGNSTRGASLSGSNVTSFADQSGNSGPAFTASASLAYQTSSGVNGRPAALFNGTTNVATQATGNMTALVAAGHYTTFGIILVVSAQSDTGTSYTNNCIYSDAGAYVGLFTTSTPTLIAEEYTSGANIAVVTPPAVGTAFTYIARRHGSVLSLSVNGAAEVDSSAITGSPVLTGAFAIGSNSRYCNMKLLTMGFFNTDIGAPASADYITLKTWLQWYGATF